MKIEINDEKVSNILEDVIDAIVRNNLEERLQNLEIERGLRASEHLKCGIFDNDLKTDLELIDILIQSLRNVINDMKVPTSDSLPKMPQLESQSDRV